MDNAKLNEFVGKALADLGGAFSVPLVRIGDRLGLYKALHASGPMTAGELATKGDVAERYVREWLSHQAASGYLAYDPAQRQVRVAPGTGDGARRDPTARFICKARSTWRR